MTVKRLIAFGASAGGLQCLRPIIRALKPNGHHAYVVASHLSPKHISNLTEILAVNSEITVVSATNNLIIQPDHVYVCSSATDIVIDEGKLQLCSPYASASIAPSIDRLLSSVANYYHEKAVAVILSGSGHDGLLGAKEISLVGGIVIVLNPEEALHTSMPDTVIGEGIADLVGGIDNIIGWLSDHERFERGFCIADDSTEKSFAGLIKLVADTTGLNATQYKEQTLRRQIVRRHRNLGLNSLESYFDYVKINPDEISLLHQAFLISVSAFFRDKEVFEALHEALKKRLANLKRGESLRVWIPGCATGEEPYSIAILLAELLDERLPEIDVRVFATDIDHKALDKARSGLYDDSCLAQLCMERKNRWFTPHLGQWRINKIIRDLVVFSAHDVMLHPPFIKMDLISCRNMLIYFKPEQQTEIIRTFHYSLNPDGLLLLGRSECVGSSRNLFDPVDAECKLFHRLNTLSVYPVRKFNPRLLIHHSSFPKPGISPQKQTQVETAAALLAKEFAPPAVLVNASFEPLHFFSHAQRFFSLQDDNVDFTVFALCLPALKSELKALCYRLIQDGLNSLEGITVMVPLEGRQVAIKPVLKRVSPLVENAEFYLLICFEESRTADPQVTVRSKTRESGSADEINMLRQELADSREHLQSVIEAMETANEELQSLTEELQSSSEELQASNEELQSSNEELTTLNDELRAKSQEAIELNEILSNIQSSIRTSLVVVDREGRISRFNKLATRIFGLVATDIGQLLNRVPCHLRLPQLQEQIEKVVSEETSILDRVHHNDFHYLMRIDPYINAQEQVAGAILTFSDISELLIAEHQRELLEKRFGQVWESSLEGLMVVQNQGLIEMANPALANMFGYQVEELTGQPIEILVPELHRNAHVQWREQFFVNPTPGRMGRMRDVCGRHRMGNEFFIEVSLSLMIMDDEPFVLASVNDITARKTADIALRRSEEQLRLALDAAKAGTWQWIIASNENIWSETLWTLYGITDRSVSPGFEAWRDSIFPGDRDRIENQVLTAAAKSEEFEGEWQVNLPAGSPSRWLMARGRPVLGDNGQAIYYRGIVLDITDRRRAEEDVRKYVSVFQHAGWGMVVVDPQTEQITHANAAFAQMHGYELNEILKSSILEHYAPEVRSSIPEQVKPANHKSHHSFESIHLRKDGSTFPCLIDMTVYRDASGQVTFRAATVEDITERKATEINLRMWGNAFEQAEFALAIGNPATNLIVAVNPMFARQRGYSQQELIGKPFTCLFPADLVTEIKAKIQDTNKLGHAIFESEHICKDGRRFPVLLDVTVTKSADGKPQARLAYVQDISERKRAEAELRLAASVFANTQEGVMVCSPDKIIIDVNPAFSRITGYSREEILGQSPRKLSSGKQTTEFYAQISESLNKNDVWRGEIWNRRKNGEVYPEILSISAVRSGGGDLLHYIGVFSDISQLKEHEAELDKIAHFDPLTGVPNRRLLTYRLDQAISSARRSGNPLAVCYLDLDFFKPINDRLGHAAGDQLLIAIAERLKTILRGEDTLARIGGDEFILLLSELKQLEESHRILTRILEEVSLPLSIENTVVQVSASIGVAIFPGDNSDADSLLRHADQAMYCAKQKGKNRYHYFDADQDRKIQVHLEQNQRLALALQRQEFVLYFQPKVNLRTGEVFGVEALIRWQHPELGLLPPSDFLGYINGSELEKAVGEWVIEAALKQLAVWHQKGIFITVSVNVGADHLLEDDFDARLKIILERHPEISGTCLDLEILETAALADMDQAVEMMNRCLAFDVGFSLDDFGTGYSSLAYFRKLPIQTLKIDQSFVRDMINDPNDFEIVESVIRLALAFNRTVIAEGVETLEHAKILLSLDCLLAQGYGISRPIPAEQFVEWLEKWQKEEVWKSFGDI